MKAGRQTTLRKPAELSGIGVHSGLPVSLTLHPAEAGAGVVFLRTDGDGEREIRAEASAVTSTEFATVLGDESGAAVSTVEHVMAALYGLGVDNATIELDGPEMPILDGSAAPFTAAIDRAGIVALPAARRYLRILRPVGVAAGDSYGELRPYDRGFRVEIEIDFDHEIVGRQSFKLDVDPLSFRRELARARTFGFVCDVERLWNSGYALGATFENTLVVSEGRVLNPEGLRFEDEFVRHKALDAVGDLALAGAPILGAYRSVRGGHRLNHAVVCAVLADPTAFALVEAGEPVRRARGRARAELGTGLLQPAFARDLS
jgi:UDP-3-O-[3-hydroxymyristoyl] N-acetylglucosamine deacetylase